MKIFGKYWWVFIAAIAIGLGLSTARIMKLTRRLKQARAKTKEMKKEVKFWEDKLKEAQLEKVKLQVEAAKKNDVFSDEIRRLIKVGNDICEAKDDIELDKILKQAELDGVFKKPWEGDFEEFMANPGKNLQF